MDNPQLHVKREKNNKIHCGYRGEATRTFFHFHSLLELYLVDEGEVDVWINEHYRRMRSGELAISLSYDAHRYEPVGEAKCTVLIAPVCNYKEFNGKKLTSPFVDAPELFNGISKCCEMIVKQKNSLITDGCVSVALGLLLQSIDLTDTLMVSERDSITQALLYLNDHFRDDITLVSTASALGFNASYLSRNFKETLGIGFNQYVAMIRLREAVRLLEKGEPVSYCVYESGFRSERTFYRVFKSEFDCTPKQYVERMRE